MNPSENKKNLDELLAKTVGHSPLKFDLDTWKQQHAQEIAEYRATCKSGASLTNKRTTQMKSLILKFAVAAGIIIAALVGIGLFDNWFGGNNVAFAQVLKNIQNRNYSFDLIPDGEKQLCRVTIKEPGRMRFDSIITGMGKISSVTDFNSGKTLILFHQNKTATIMENPVLNTNSGAEGITGLCTKPVSALWNLKDGTEKSLGVKDIDGQKAAGFAVSQEDEFFHYDMVIWARTDNSTPCLVEVTTTSKKEKQAPMKWTMQKYEMDVQCDDCQFSLETPAGYTLAYQKSLDQIAATGTSSPTAKEIENALGLWVQDKKNEAVVALLGIDWTQSITFAGKPTVFTLTEKGYITLKSQDQNTVSSEVMPLLSKIKAFASHLVTQGQAAAAAGDNDKAEKYYTTGNHLGQLLVKDPELMIITRLMGISVQKMNLNELVKLYTQTNNQEKLQAAQKQLQTVTALKDEIIRKAKGQ